MDKKIVSFLSTPAGLLFLFIIGLAKKAHIWFQQNQTSILIVISAVVLVTLLGVYLWERQQRPF